MENNSLQRVYRVGSPCSSVSVPGDLGFLEMLCSKHHERKTVVMAIIYNESTKTTPPQKNTYTLVTQCFERTVAPLKHLFWFCSVFAI